MYTGILILARKVAEVYFSDLWLLSRMTSTDTPLFLASMSALAIGAEVKEYAWTRISVFAFRSSLIMAEVQPPLGLK